MKRRVPDDLELPCPHCGYDLRAQVGPTGARCPECGDFVTHVELFPRWEGLRSVDRAWYSLSLLQLILVPALMLFIIGPLAGGTGVLSITPPVVILFNLLLAWKAVPAPVRIRRPRTIVSVAVVFFAINGLIAMGVIGCFVTVFAILLGGLEFC